MLERIRKKAKAMKPAGGHFAIVASTYNARYVDGMLQAAQTCLEEAGVQTIKIVRVPGAFEIPVVAARLAASYSPSLAGIICLGVILRGETTHAQNIAESVSQSLAQIQIQTGVPIIHEVLLLERVAQAEVRCMSAKHNRGAEAAQTALEMRSVMEGLLKTESIQHMQGLIRRKTKGKTAKREKEKTRKRNGTLR